MKIRTAIFGVYVAAATTGFAVLMAFVLRDVRLRYVEAMRRTMGDTASFLAVFAAEDVQSDANWTRRLAGLPPKAELLRVFACDEKDRVVFDSTHGRDVGQLYEWTMRGGGHAASENYTLINVAEVDGELRVRAAVRRDGKLLGWVGVGRPLATVAEAVSRARWKLISYAGWVGVVMLAAGWWLAARLTRSLERLTAHVQAVRDGRGGREAMLPGSRAKEIAELARAFAEMRTALEGKAYVERYTQALTHELKAPLSAIRGAAELLGEDLPTADRARFLANLRAETERIQGIVDRLLELAALEARNGRLDLAVVDLRAVTAEIVAAAATAALARKVNLTLVEGGPVRVRGEVFLLGQAVSNLVQNALAFTPPGGAITLTVTAGVQACVVVEDTGPGVPDYALPRMGERFYSLPRPDTGRKSTGLGLSIVREIVRLHGGEFTLTNRPGGGARAELTLPTHGG
jgi:two-component system, OmpR family, sensor histidine kinase CreC